MTFDNLPNQWQESNAQAASQQLREEALVRVCRSVEGAKASVRSRDIIETVAAILVVVFFGVFLFVLSSGIAELGCAILIVWAIYIVYRLHHTRLEGRTTKNDLNVCQYYQREAENVERQIAMLRSVLWWYILPCFVGVNLVFYGASSSLLASSVYFVVTILFCVGVWWINQLAVAKKFLPLRREINALLDELKESPSE